MEWNIRMGERQREGVVWMPGALARKLAGEHPHASRFEAARETRGRSEVEMGLHLDDPPDRIEFYSEHLRPGVFQRGLRLNPVESFRI